MKMHIGWQKAKIESFVLERSQCGTLALYIWGVYCLCTTPETVKQIARVSINAAAAQKNEELASRGKRTNITPACQY